MELDEMMDVKAPLRAWDVVGIRQWRPRTTRSMPCLFLSLCLRFLSRLRSFLPAPPEVSLYRLFPLTALETDNIIKPVRIR